jgi:hypothetical protein
VIPIQLRPLRRWSDRLYRLLRAGIKGAEQHIEEPHPDLGIAELQTYSDVSPPSARVEANGEPLSLWIAFGNPYLSNSRSQAVYTRSRRAS